jgi:hypothetical protein
MMKFTWGPVLTGALSLIVVKRGGVRGTSVAILSPGSKKVSQAVELIMRSEEVIVAASENPGDAELSGPQLHGTPMFMHPNDATG